MFFGFRPPRVDREARSVGQRVSRFVKACATQMMSRVRPERRADLHMQWRRQAADAVGVAIPDERADAANCRKWLLIGGVTVSRWRLHDDANLDFLEAQIKAAMRARDAITVDVVSDDLSTTRRLVLNGAALHFVELVSQGEGSRS